MAAIKAIIWDTIAEWWCDSALQSTAATWLSGHPSTHSSHLCFNWGNGLITDPNFEQSGGRVIRHNISVPNNEHLHVHTCSHHYLALGGGHLCKQSLWHFCSLHLMLDLLIDGGADIENTAVCSQTSVYCNWWQSGLKQQRRTGRQRVRINPESKLH